MGKHRDLILKTDWDTLVILDACRYDYFEKNYRDFLEGELEPVVSASYGTGEWFNKVFARTTFKDTVYISANPHINSVGVGKCNASNVFNYVADVWEEVEKTIVYPELVSAFAREISKEWNERMVIHYLQPHRPFINDKSIDRGFLNHIIFKIPYRLRRKLSSLPIISNLSMSPNFKRKSCEEIKKLYEENLRIVMKEVSKLLPLLDGETVITSDHGEALGKNGEFGHRKMKVPWMTEVKKVEKKNECQLPHPKGRGLQLTDKMKSF